MSNENQLYALTYDIRKCFNQLKSLSDTLLHDMNVNPSMRAVLEALNQKDGLTVPQIAKLRCVSRQHIQIIMNSLEKFKYVKSSANPKNKRSPVFSMTVKGKTLFMQIKLLEVNVVKELAEQFTGEEIIQLSSGIERLNSALAALLNNKTHV